MPAHPFFSRIRRPILITVWVVAAFVAWFAIGFACAKALNRFNPWLLRSAIRAVPQAVLLPAVLFVGPMFAVTVTAYFALRGKLPGTRPKPAGDPPPSGFPVVSAPPPPPADEVDAHPTGGRV